MDEKIAGKYVKVFHASPEADITLFRGTHSQKFNMRGLFVSPTFKSIKQDWAGYVFNKRSRSDPHHPYKHDPYDNLTVYTLAVPRGVYESSRRVHQEKAQEAWDRNGIDSLGAWGWGAETFIPAEYLDQIRIIGRTTLMASDLTTKVRRPTEGMDPTTLAEKLKATNLAAKLYLEIVDVSAASVLAHGKRINPLQDAKELKGQLVDLFLGRNGPWAGERIEKLVGPAVAEFERIERAWRTIVRPELESEIPPELSPVRIAARYLNRGAW